MKISNSQMVDFAKCERRFKYAQIDKLRPKQYPEAMQRGIDGHELFEAFFKCMQQGGTYEDCVMATNSIVEKLLQGGANHPSLLIYRHVLAFGAYCFQMEYEVVSVEENRLAPTDVVYYWKDEFDEIEFAFTIDVVFRHTRGPRRGSLFALDFKFTAQQWNDIELGTYQQLPKYMIYWNKMNPDDKIVSLGVVNLLTRAAAEAPKEKLYVVKWLKVTKEKLARIDYENNLWMNRIAAAKSNPDYEYLRTPDSHQCKMCFFGVDLCPAELEGRDISKYIALNYEINTYFDENYEEGDVIGSQVP